MKPICKHFRVSPLSHLSKCLTVTLVILWQGLPSLWALKDPPLRTGLWFTEKIPENDEKLKTFEKELAGSSGITGVCLHFGWNDIESQSGKPDFSALDKAVEVVRKAGLKYQLGLEAGIHTPNYVFAEGAQRFETQVENVHRATFGQSVTIPVPWDPIYERNFSRMIAQLGQRYSADSSCVSVVLSCANFVSSEMHLPKTATDRAKWHAMGDYQSKLLGVYKRYTDEWAKAFPKQAITLHLSKVLDLPAEFNQQVIDYGVSKYPDRFTVQNNQLTGRREDMGKIAYDLILQNQGKVHHGFQSAAGFSRGGERMGSMEVAVLNVVHATGEYWELWHGDGINPKTSTEVARIWKEAKALGYEGYRKKLLSAGLYRSREDDTYHRKVNGRRKAAPDSGL